MQLFLAIMLLSCAQFGGQLFLPALPEVAQYFDLRNDQAQQLIMLYFLGFGFSQLVFGPWSDVAGRRKVFLFGQSLFIIGSLLCAFAQIPEILGVGRVVQGIGAGAPLIVSRTLLSDNLYGSKLKQAMASLAIAASVTSVIATPIGGWLTTETSWQTLFLITTVYLVVTWWIGARLIAVQKNKPRKNSVGVVLKEFSSLMTDHKFILPSLFKWLPTLVYFVSATFLPFELQNRLALSAEQYGFYMTLPALGLIVGTLFARFAQRHLGYETILVVLLPLILLSGIGLYSFEFSLLNCLVSYSLFMMCAGAYYPCSLHLLVQPFRDKAGTVNALCGAIDMIVFSSIAIFINRFWVVDTQSLGELYIMVAIILGFTLLFGHFQRGNKPATNNVDQTTCSRRLNEN